MTKRDLAGELRDFARSDRAAECAPEEHLAWEAADVVSAQRQRLEEAMVALDELIPLLAIKAHPAITNARRLISAALCDDGKVWFKNGEPATMTSELETNSRLAQRAYEIMRGASRASTLPPHWTDLNLVEREEIVNLVAIIGNLIATRSGKRFSAPNPTELQRFEKP